MSRRHASHSSLTASSSKGTQHQPALATSHLKRLLAIPHVQYVAEWVVLRSLPVPAEPTLQSGSATSPLPLKQRQLCLQRAVQQPGQPFLLGDQEPVDSVYSQAVIATWAFSKRPSNDEYSVLEIRFEADTHLDVATDSLQKVMDVFLQDGAIPSQVEKTPHPMTSSPPTRPRLSEQVYSAAGLTPHMSRSPEPASVNSDADLEAWTALVRHVHQSLEPGQTDLNVCNELLTFLDLDRVSVLRNHRGRWHIQAISGQTTVNRRSPLVQQLETLARGVFRTGQQLVYPCDSVLPSQLRVPLEVYLIDSEIRFLTLIPVFDQASEMAVENDDHDESQRRPQAIAGIVLESLAQDYRPNLRAIETACQLAGDAIRVSHQHRQLLFFPVWQRLGQARVVTWSRRIPVAWLLLGLLIFVAALCFWPTPFYVSCQGTLVPLHRSRIYAPHNGIIEEIYVHPQENISIGTPLVRMRDYQLESQIQQVQREQIIVEEKLRAGNRRIRTDQTRQRYVSSDPVIPLSVLEQEKNHLLNQQSLLEQQKQQLLINSPISGRVMTWQVNDQLLQRPVPFGRLIMEIADTGGPWKLELNLPNRRVGHLLSAMKNAQGQPLQVEFVLAAKPERRYYGTLAKVSSTTAVSREEGAFVKLEVEIDDTELEILQNETEVTAKIFCGDSVLGHLWLHDITEFLQTKVFFFTW